MKNFFGDDYKSGKFSIENTFLGYLRKKLTEKGDENFYDLEKF